ncbi:hypothetical protein BDA99DRAFT_544287 [Phascolomyces articulosus]|uniref:Uncharacterized protein n=1 Tax=Phascolomyces articulosus TaxID=60185 RepID=A0AAD5JWC1_9FUNG|nr:hypothetical protein BDA99DRAFT_544287 [Phascolomyces articulosus]
MNNDEQDANANPNSDAIENRRRIEEVGKAKSSIIDKVVQMYKQIVAKYDFEDRKGIIREPNEEYLNVLKGDRISKYNEYPEAPFVLKLMYMSDEDSTDDKSLVHTMKKGLRIRKPT